VSALESSDKGNRKIKEDKKMKRKRIERRGKRGCLYHDRYAICLYGKEGMLDYMFEGVDKMSIKTGMKKSQLAPRLTRLMNDSNDEEIIKWGGEEYSIILVDIS